MKAPGPRDFIVNRDGQPSPVMAAFMRDLVTGGSARYLVRPEDFTGTDAERLAAAFGAAVSEGVPAWLDGVYTLDAPLDTVAMTDGVLAVRGAGRIHVAADMGRALVIHATYPTPVSVSSITATTHSFPGVGTTASTATRIAAPGHGCSEGDLFKIVADNAIPGGTDSNRRIGEFGWVGDVDGDDIYMPGLLNETYTTSPRLVRVRKEPRLIWDGPTFSSTDDQEDWAIIHLTVRGFVQPFVRTRIDQVYDTGLDISSCIMAEVHVDGVKARNRVSSEGVPGYLMADSQSWMTRAYVAGAGSRHSYTTLTNTSSAGGEPYLFGRTRGSVVTGVAVGSSAAAFDVHPEAESVTFHGLSTSQAFLGEDASGTGAQFRGRKNKILSFTDRHSNSGVQFFANAADGCNDNELVDCDLTGPIRVGSSSATETVVRPRVRRGIIRTSASSSVQLWKCSGVVIEDLVLAPTGSGTTNGVILNGDAEARIRNLTIDLTDFTGSNNFRAVAFASSSTGNSVVIERIRITGASGKMQAVFNGASTSGTAIMALRPDWLDTDAAAGSGLTINTGSMTVLVDGQTAPAGWTPQPGTKVWAYAPGDGEAIGWVYTADANWKEFGAIAA